jgi:heat shock protein HtpX
MWEQIRANRRRSIFLIMGMSIVLSIMGYVAGEAIASGAGPLGLLFALVLLAFQLGMYALAAESILLQGMGAKELSKEDSPRLFNIVDEMVIASGLGYTPKIYLVDAIAPNAFAIGRKPETSAVTVTSGLMYRLNRDELQGVIAHEIGHLKNLDVRFMTLAGVLIGTIVILADLSWRMIANGGGRTRSRSESRGNDGGNVIIVLIALAVAILGPILAHVLYFAISRSREYLADASAAQFTRYPEGLASALNKIDGSNVKLSVANRTNAPMFIINPLAAGGDAGGIFATHPPTAERIRILQGMGGGASFVDYERAYENISGKRNLIGEKTLSQTPVIPLRVPSAEGPVENRQAARATFQRLYGYISLQCDCGAVMRIPETYPENHVICIRCGVRNEVPTVEEVIGPATEARKADIAPLGGQENAPPMMYRRKTMGWESFRCTCGGTVQLGPSFAGARTWCPRCRQQIEIEDV